MSIDFPIAVLVEDDAALLELSADFVRERGYAVCCLPSLESAWNWIREDPLVPALIVSDYHLGDGDTFDWLVTAREAFAATQIICCSGHIPEGRAQALRDLGIPVQSKPVDLAGIVPRRNAIA